MAANIRWESKPESGARRPPKPAQSARRACSAGGGSQLPGTARASS